MIKRYSFGLICIGDKHHRHDLKIIGGRVIENWRRIHGHWMDVEDSEDLLSSQPRILVVGTGRSGGLRITEALRAVLESKQIHLISAPTEEAVGIFNSLLAEGEEVAGAFHLTC